MKFRRRTLLPLDDVMGSLLESVAKLSRSSLHTCLQRHGISRTPAGEIKTTGRGEVCTHRNGLLAYRHYCAAPGPRQAQYVSGHCRVSKFTSVEFWDDIGKMNGADFLQGVIKAFLYKIHTVLTDNGIAFTDLPKHRNKPIHVFLEMHVFGGICNENGIVHKLSKPYDPWTNGQAERMNRTIKEATIKTFHYPNLESLKAHVLAFV